MRIEVLKKGRINRIRVEGTHQDRAAAVIDITNMLRVIQDESKFEEHAELLHKQVRQGRWMPEGCLHDLTRSYLQTGVGI